MKKIDIKAWEDKVNTTVMCCMVSINELVEGYNEIKKRLDKRDEEVKKLVAKIKHDLYDDK